ncbi:MAG: DUF2851 family protein [Muribaculaceae bacterium]|nr:DUF2851 family protein [Muribaculaceae bacterium]
MEKLMQYVWQQRLWPVGEMRTVDGKRVEVIDPGLLNTDAGPDFFNAKVAIAGETWVGNVEIHYRASDWARHHHDDDRAYDSVILHVVDKDDAVVRRPDGQVVPQMRMPCDPGLNSRYSELVGRADIDLPCAREIAALPPVYTTDWISSLAYERIYEKADRVEAIRSRLSGDWEQTCYVTVARGLGFGINSEPFERLALSLPLMFIGKHSDNLTSIEALLFGQSGLLDARPGDEYAARLKKEYDFFAVKFGLRRPESLGWKMARMRPANFPHRRIAVLAAMLHGGFRMMSRIVDVQDIDTACALFTPDLSPYWQGRCSFGAPGGRMSCSLSRSSALVMVINVVVPLMMAYGISHGDSSLTDRAVELLHEIKAEKNSIVELFERAGLKVNDAFSSQGVIQLRRNYCEKRKCLFCRIGHRKLSYCARRRE